MTSQKSEIILTEGILPLNKPPGETSFNLVRLLRKHLNVQKIGHAGTLDPFATGVLIMLIGRNYTKLADFLQNVDKEYIGKIRLGSTTDTFDKDGKIIQTSTLIPEKKDIDDVIKMFQGDILQLPPMYSAKKYKGKKLYEYARKGQIIKRDHVKITVETKVIDYNYPYLNIWVGCSKGTYIRTIANDIGSLLGCGGHLESLTRLRSGHFHLSACFDGKRLFAEDFDNHEIINKILNYENIQQLGCIPQK